jgi:hypothetical protein
MSELTRRDLRRTVAQMRQKPQESLTEAMSLARIAALDARIGVKMGKVTSPDKLAVLEAHRAKLAEARARLEFSLSEADPKWKPWRKLTERETRHRVDLLAERFGEIRVKLSSDLTEAVSAEAARIRGTTLKRLTAGDYKAAGIVNVLVRGSARQAVKDAIGASYMAGKVSAANNARIERPATPQASAAAMAMDAENRADALVSQLEHVARASVRAGFAAKASPSATAARVQKDVEAEARRFISNLAGTIPGEYVNLGRGDVFERISDRIVAYERTEVIDAATCETCLSLDGRVIAPDDPFRAMDIVHSNCGGIWLPIYSGEADIPSPSTWGLPKSITSKFDTVDGMPMVNSFRNMRRPLPKSEAAKAETVTRGFTPGLIGPGAASPEDIRVQAEKVTAEAARQVSATGMWSSFPSSAESVPIKSLVTDQNRPPEGWKTLTTTDRESVDGIKAAIEAGKPLPPIELWRQRDGSYYVMDGNHRAKAYDELGIPNVTAVVHQMPAKQ